LFFRLLFIYPCASYGRPRVHRKVGPQRLLGVRPPSGGRRKLASNGQFTGYVSFNQRGFEMDCRWRPPLGPGPGRSGPGSPPRGFPSFYLVFGQPKEKSAPAKLLGRRGAAEKGSHIARPGLNVPAQLQVPTRPVGEGWKFSRAIGARPALLDLGLFCQPGGRQGRWVSKLNIRKAVFFPLFLSIREGPGSRGSGFSPAE